MTYSEQDINRAVQELKELTPEEYLDMLGYLEEARRGLPEAPASVSIKGYTPSGLEILFTARDFNPYRLISEMNEILTVLADDVAFGPKTANIVSSTQSQPEQQQVQDTGIGIKESIRITSKGAGDDVLTRPGIDSFDVVSVTHLETENTGKPYLSIKGKTPGPYGKFGVKAWPEILPVPIENFPLRTTQAPPANMTVVFYDTERKRVVAFGEKV